MVLGRAGGGSDHVPNPYIMRLSLSDVNNIEACAVYSPESLLYLRTFAEWVLRPIDLTTR